METLSHRHIHALNRAIGEIYSAHDMEVVLQIGAYSIQGIIPHGYGLSCSETEVLKWLSKGKSDVEIVVILGVSRRTVENIFATLGVETRAAAAAVVTQG